MSLIDTKSLLQCPTAGEALDELCGVFPSFPAGQASYEPVAPQQMPDDVRTLLVHNRHMTLVLGEYYASPVDLYVMDVRREADTYSRKIFLTRPGRAAAIELGVVRINMRYLGERVQDEIVDQHTPLGAILVKHNVLRRIEPRWYLKFPANSPILDWFGCPGAGPFYGRIGTIYCNDEPAIELLEIVTLWDRQEA